MSPSKANRTHSTILSDPPITHLTVGNMESIALNGSEKELFDESGLPATSSTTSIMYSNQVVSRSHSSRSSYGLESCSLAPIPCVVSSILRKKNYSSSVTLSREGKMNEILDSMGILNSSSQSTEVETNTVDTQEAFPYDFAPSTIVLQGLAGSGKTKLAAMFCHRVDVRQHFAHGGIAWVDLSRHTSTYYKRNQSSFHSNEESINDKKSDVSSRSETSTTSEQKSEHKPRRRWTASGFINLNEDQALRNSRHNPSNPPDIEENDANLNKEKNSLEYNEDNLLCFGDGIRPISNEDLIKCYVTICNQLDIPIPKPFQHIFHKKQGVRNEAHQESKYISDYYGDGNEYKEQYRQIMANHLHRAKFRISSKTSKKTPNGTQEQKKLLVVLDNLWHPEDIEWFEFNLIETNIYLLVTTRLSSDFGNSQRVKLGVLSDDEASALIMCNKLFEKKDYSQEGPVEDFLNSYSAQKLSKQLASLCGNLPSAIVSVNRWINNIISTQKKSPRKVMEEVAGLLESSNIFQHDPETIEDLDLFKILDRSLDSRTHGESASRIMKLCIASFAVVFAKRNKKINKDDRSGCVSLSIPDEYVKILWDNLLASEIISQDEKYLVSGIQTKPQKYKDEFNKIREACITLGILDEVLLDTSDGRKVSCLKFSHPIYQLYGEFILIDSEDPLKTQNYMSPSRIEEIWNNVMATECDKKSGRWDSWEILQGTVDDHLFEMLPTYMIRGNMLEVALSLLMDKSFIQGRLTAMGIVTGTKCHITDCELIHRYMKKDKKLDGKSSFLSAFSKVKASLTDTSIYVSSTDKDSSIIDKEVSLALHEMANSLYQKKFYDVSLKFVETCLKCKIDAFGEDHEEIANTISLKARIYEKKGIKENKWTDKALEEHQKALKIRQSSCPSMHLDIATSLISIGNIFLNKEDYLKTINSLEEALHIRKHITGDDNEESAETLCSLGLAYQEVEAYNKALICYERALKVKQIIVGENSRACADIISQIAKLHKEAKQNNLALQRFKEALRLFRIIGMERDDPDVVEATLFVNWVTSNTTRKQID